jgi:hypothetical protein
VSVTQAQDKTPPTVVVRAESLNALLSHLNLVVKLIGQDEAGTTIDGLIKSKIGNAGLEGIDPAQPFGAYVRFGKSMDDLQGAILIPMADEKAFLKFVGTLDPDLKKDNDGIYTYKTKTADIFFRFAHKYAFVTTVNVQSIQDKNLVEPAKALNVAGASTFTVVAQIDQIPNDAKLLALEWLKETLIVAEKSGAAGETKPQEAFRVALLRDAHKFAAQIVREGGEARLDLGVNEKAKDLTVNVSVKAKPGSDLAKAIKDLGDVKSPLAGVFAENQAFQGAVNLKLSADLSKTFADLVAEVKQKSIEGIQSKEKQVQAALLFDALMPTATSGEWHAAAAVLGAREKQYGFVAAVKLKDGIKLGNTVRDLIAESLKDKAIPDAERDKIKLDFDSVGAVKIHRMQMPKEASDTLQKLTGDDKVYLAFRDDALFLATGQDALPALKTAIGKTDAAASGSLSFDFDMARMAGMMAMTVEEKALASKLFPAGQSSRVRFAIDGGPALTVRLQMQFNALEYLMKAKAK